MRPRLVLAPVLLALLVPAVAQADYRIAGRGFGHGVGMSQWGAHGAAAAKVPYTEILERYYPGTTLTPRPTGIVRVLLAASEGPVAVSGVRSVDGHAVAPGAVVRFAAPKRVRGRTRHVPGVRTVRTRTYLDGELVLRGRALDGTRNGRYRGQLELIRDGRALLVVNHVSSEEYLLGVVAAEMPASWPEDALRAQAVAARTYVHRRLASPGAFDVYADVRSQAYGGMGAEDPRTTKAVYGTSGQVLMLGTEIAETPYTSSNGGLSESPEAVWGGRIPNTAVLADPWDVSASPWKRWRRHLTDRQMASKLRGLYAGRLRSIRIIDRGPGGRATRVRLRGSGGDRTIGGARFQARLGLPDRWVNVSRGRPALPVVPASATPGTPGAPIAAEAAPQTTTTPATATAPTTRVAPRAPVDPVW